MRVFHCDHCESLVFFENTHCLRCGHLLAFLPDLMEIGSLDPTARRGGPSGPPEATWHSPHPAAAGRTYGQKICEIVPATRRSEMVTPAAHSNG